MRTAGAGKPAPSPSPDHTLPEGPTMTPIFTALLAEFRATGPIALSDDED